MAVSTITTERENVPTKTFIVPRCTSTNRAGLCHLSHPDKSNRSGYVGITQRNRSYRHFRNSNTATQHSDNTAKQDILNSSRRLSRVCISLSEFFNKSIRINSCEAAIPHRVGCTVLEHSIAPC